MLLVFHFVLLKRWEGGAVLESMLSGQLSALFSESLEECKF